MLEVDEHAECWKEMKMDWKNMEMAEMMDGDVVVVAAVAVVV